MDVQPRQIVAYFRAGDLDSILRSRTIWICASCYACTVRCPAGIKVTDLIYALKRMALDRNYRSRGGPIHVLSRSFVDIVNKYGRNQEGELIIRYTLRLTPGKVFSLLPMAWRLLRARRLPLKRHRIRGLAGLRRIISRAEAMEHVYPREALRPLGKVGYGVVAEEAVREGGNGR
jgi:heterodisulfide reductase subunit C